MFEKTVLLAAISAFLAVAMGAFGAHALKQYLSTDLLTTYQTAVHYHMVHSLALLLLGLLGDKLNWPSALIWSACCLGIGIILFSGSLYVLALSGLRWLGAITPIGGVFFLVGWILMAVGVYQQNNP